MTRHGMTWMIELVERMPELNGNQPKAKSAPDKTAIKPVRSAE
jgi:hypothetical protein